MICIHKPSLAKSSIFLLFFLLTTVANAATIRGRVIDGDTHETIPGAVVSILGIKSAAFADANGNYSFNDLRQGTYTITAKCVGYENLRPQEIDLTTPETTITFDIYLKPSVKQIHEVIIQGERNKETDVTARHDERVAPNVINIISAKTIESLPDQNVADVMQRVSGVSMTKNSFGSNSNVIIRGMPSRYNSVLVDGVVMPSTSSSGRSVSLDMFGSELVGRIEVIKSLTPDLEADAIGGTVNIRTKQAPDSAFFKVQVGSGYNQYYFNHSFLTFDNSVVAKKDPSELNGPNYLADASIFPRKNLIVKAKQAIPDLNINLAGGRRFFNNKLGIMIAASAQSTAMANTYDYTSYIAGRDNNKPASEYLEHQVYSKNQKRYGGYVKMDYQFNSKNQVSLFSSLFQINELRVREYADHSTDNTGSFIRPIETQTETDNSGLSCTTLRGEHKLLDNLDLDWTLLYASANSHSPDFVSIEEAQRVGDPVYLNYATPLIRNWQWDVDQNKSAYMNINYKPTIFDHIFEFKVGGMYRSKFRKNYANEYHFDCDTYQSYPYPDLLTVPFTNDKSGADGQQKKGNAYLNPGNYRAWEDIGAVYGMVNSTFGKLQILTGVRFETTYMTNQHNQNNIQIPVASSTFRYFDLFPSIHLTYKFTDMQNLRFSVYRAINRPDYTEVIPYSNPRAGGQSGNPKLQPAYGNCVDLRYEIYPQREEVFTAGVFYKKINKAIEEILSESDNKKFTNDTISPCTNYGLELVAIKYFGNFGFSANYTYTHSSVSDKWHDFVYKNNIYDTVIAINKTRPFVGQSPHLFNLSVSYRNARWGFKSSITYTLQGNNLVAVNDHYHFDSYQATYHNLGLTIEQKIGKRFFLTVKASNLLNSPITYYMKLENSTLIRKAYNYQSYYIGLKISI